MKGSLLCSRLVRQAGSIEKQASSLKACAPSISQSHIRGHTRCVESKFCPICFILITFWLAHILSISPDRKRTKVGACHCTVLFFDVQLDSFPT